MIGIRGFTPTLRQEGQWLLDFRPPVTPESRARLTLPIVRAFGRSFPVVRAPAGSPLSGECPARADRRLRPTLPSADSCATIGEPHDSFSPSATDVGSGHGAGLPRSVRPPSPHTRRIYNHRPLMDEDFAVSRPLVRPGRPHIRFLFVRSRLCSALPSDPA